MQKAIMIALTLALLGGALRADGPAASQTESRVATGKAAVIGEIRRYATDAKGMATEPLRWNRLRWLHLAEGSAAVAAVYFADRRLSDRVQANRNSFTDDFARVVTPFGGRRAEYVSAALIGGGIWTGDANMRDAGRDSLEAEIVAGGLVTPLLKRVFGRARPIQEEGARSFHPFSSNHESFPSGHATNAFACATAIAGHYDGWIVPTVVYSIATGVAMSRVNDRAHFPADVLAGALIGRAIAKSIVGRHRRGNTTWLIAPSWLNDRPGITLRILR
ncbi:MAG: phosphatase PAP2 family protein [Acidobacteriota bacterium]